MYPKVQNRCVCPTTRFPPEQMWLFCGSLQNQYNGSDSRQKQRVPLI